MRLKRFRVTDFRSVVDSGWIECDNITIFAGDNESGKTTLFFALMKLMTPEQLTYLAKMRSNIHDIAKIDLKKDIPIGRIAELTDIEHRVFISAEFALTDSINAELVRINPNYKPLNSVVISKNYGGDYSIDLLSTFDNEQIDEAKLWILANIPKLSYYQEVVEVSSSIDLITLALKLSGQSDDNTLTVSETMFGRLLTCLDIWESNLIKTIAEAETVLNLSQSNIDFRHVFQTVPLFRKRVERGFERLNEQFVECWGRDDLTIGFEGYNRGIIIKIIDRNTGNQYYLENRSTGFRRFFAHFLTFSITGIADNDDSLLMFDEAGAAMHSITQRKLADYFLKVGKRSQVLYNTHSSYMIPVKHMNNVRVVYKNINGYTNVSRRLIITDDRVNELSLFPIQSSLGLYIAEKSLSGCLPIIVLSEEDEAYLTLIKNMLIAKGKLRTIYQSLVFSAGIDGMDAICDMFGDGSDLPVVLLGSDDIATSVKSRLLASLYKDSPEKIRTVSNYLKDAVYIEDLIPAMFIEIPAKHYILKQIGPDFKFAPKSKSVIAPVLDYAKQRSIELPSNFRYEIAKRVRLNLMSFYSNVRIPYSHRKCWEKLWKDLIKLSE
ncbi:MAG: AAA family ATPase [Christensenellaceae bacterium]|jgi:energy-coupling factor transporter ATP-binding protein EcfA2|nr:AAA family ATPase [Christensenellaceae bacterium]